MRARARAGDVVLDRDANVCALPPSFDAAPPTAAGASHAAMAAAATASRTTGRAAATAERASVAPAATPSFAAAFSSLLPISTGPAASAAAEPATVAASRR